MALNKKFFTTGGIVASSPTEGAFDPLQNFETVTYTGNGSTQSITSLDFQPDLVWIKQRSAAGNHSIFDSVRGVQKYLLSNSTVQETDYSGDNGVTSFDSNGFTVDDTGGIDYSVNHSGTYVSWCWKAGGAAVSNTDGTITSSVSANQAAGFSIVKWTAPSDYTQTVGHGLSQAPELVITKNLGSSIDWYVFYDVVDGSVDYMSLNTTGTYGNTSAQSFTSTTIKSWWGVTENIIAYCFHSVDGYQKIGSYTGTGASGNTITTGFQPRFVMIKNTASGYSWIITDSTRQTGKILYPNLASAEFTLSTGITSFTSNGFILGTDVSHNNSGDTFIYLAIA